MKLDMEERRRYHGFTRMTDLENFKMLGAALAIGLLLGLERGWHARERDEGKRVAGLRTYGIISLLGGLSGILAQEETSPFLMGFVFLGLASVLFIAYSKSLDKFEDFSITGIVASMITFILGALTVFGHIKLASASAVIITLLLSFKPLLHGWLKKLEPRELDATLKLLLISVVMLPILPDRDYGPWAINPYHVWWMVVLITGVSYLGYFAIKIVGNRHGPVLTGAFGGLVSSTAVTLNLSKLTAHYPNMENGLAAGILTACATMFARTLLLASILNPAVFRVLLPALLLMSVLTYAPAFLLWRNAREFRTTEDVTLENPFQLGMALKFGAFLVAIMLLSKLLNSYFGDLGTYFIAASSGLADVDPITLSMSQMTRQGLDVNVAAKAILIAVSVNSGVKAVFSWVIGGRALGFRVGGALLAAVAAGLLFVWA